MGEGECKVFILHDVLNGGRRKESVAGNGDHLGGGLESVGRYLLLSSFGGDSSSCSQLHLCLWGWYGEGAMQWRSGVEWGSWRRK